MKKLNRLIFTSLLIITPLIINGCDPFNDIYVTLAMETEFSTIGIGTTINLSSSLCLSDFSDYEDNKDKVDEIRYISAAYLTLNATQGLRGDNLTLTFYQGDGSTILFKYILPVFDANFYVNNPLELTLTQQEIDNINLYLTNPKEDKCFVATLQVSNVQSSTITYELHSKFQFLTELKVKP